jgi:hypothetical protein
VAVVLFLCSGCENDQSNHINHKQHNGSVYSGSSVKDLYMITDTGEMKLIYSNITLCDYNDMRIVFRTEDGKHVRYCGPYAVITR